MREIVEVELPDGEVVLAEVTVIDSDIGALDRFKLDEARSAVVKIGAWARNTLRDSLPEPPDRFGVEIGLKLAIKSGALTSILAEASTEASVVIKMEWDRRG
ncbi:MAG TPA: CU044_2847 family protein [Candidatus Limnocylindrales bacterium]